MTTSGYAQNFDPIAAPKKSVDTRSTVYRSSRTGRVYTEGARIAAAQARVSADKKRGVETAPWIVELAKKA